MNSRFFQSASMPLLNCTFARHAPATLSFAATTRVRGETASPQTATGNKTDIANTNAIKRFIAALLIFVNELNGSA
jgi:hypothetical protein